MIIDARPANCHFEDADSVRLCTSQSFVEVRADDQEPLFISGVDIEVAFYAIELPEWLRPLFCLEPVAAWRVGVTEVGASR